MEAYLAYSDLDGMMELTESMYKHIAESVFNKYTFNWCGNEIDLSKPFKKISMTDAIKDVRITSLNVHHILFQNNLLDSIPASPS